MTKKSSRELLNDSIHQVRLASNQLKIAYNHCSMIDLNHILNDSDLLSLEALTARFGRLVDMLTSKLLRTIDMVELSSEGTLIDAMNRAEKRGLISSASDLRVLKELRNDVVHEYQINNLNMLHESIYKSVPQLLNMVEVTLRYAEDLLKKF
jgi:uncharacterized protein YutE (UPF0331/DUF86 family)